MRSLVSSVSFLLFSNLICPILSTNTNPASTTPSSILSNLHRLPGRGGGGISTVKKRTGDDDAFYLLGDAIQSSLHRLISSSTSTPTTTHEPASLECIAQSLALLSKSQSTLKSIDGASHEFYQRSHSLETSTRTELKGRAARSAGRTGCCADALFACELLDLIADPPPDRHQNAAADDGVISNGATGDERRMEPTVMDLGGGREVLLNVTLSTASIPLEVLVLYEAEYAGGGGIHHGGIDGLLSSPVSQHPRGRILIVVQDGHEADLKQTLKQLDHAPEFVDLEEGLAQEVACINGILWRCAEELLAALEPILRHRGNATAALKTEGDDGTEQKEMTLPAVHFVARSLAGGVVSLAAAMLNGGIPMPPVTRRKRKGQAHSRKAKGRKKYKADHQDDDDDRKVTSKEFFQKGEDREKSKINSSLHGFAKGRTSAVVIGAPPSLSSNVEAPFITSVIHGDDVVCRTTKDSLDKLRKRTIKAIKKNIFMKRLPPMADCMNLLVSGIQTHAHGSEGEEARLSLAGTVYLVRPRRISGGVSSMHEIGAAGGREALRAAVLWSLRDVLLSKSLWAHHSLEAYIAGLDKVQLRKFSAEDSDEE